ncbi:MAG: Gfo/Idh/MocA family oxidoreductase, partial [Streptomyces sp.]
MRIGLIGTGRIGTFHSAALQRHPEVHSLVVADADAGRAAGLAARIGAASASSVDDVFTGSGRSGSVDAVV